MLIIFEKPIAKNNDKTNKFEEKTKAYELVGSVVAGGVVLAGSYLAKNPDNPVSKLYNKHESTILAGCNIGCGLMSNVLVAKNARKITDRIEEAKVKMAEAPDDATKNRIRVEALKELSKLITPIVIFQGIAIGATVKMKKSMDVKDLKIAELSEALTLANTTIAAYQNFKKEVTKEIGKEKVEELEKQAVNGPNVGGKWYHYYDVVCAREFDSMIAPSKIMDHVQWLNSMYGKSTHKIITYQDVYDVFDDEKWIVVPDVFLSYGWIWNNEWDYREPWEGKPGISVEVTPVFRDPDNKDYGVTYEINMFGDYLDNYY